MERALQRVGNELRLVKPKTLAASPQQRVQEGGGVEDGFQGRDVFDRQARAVHVPVGVSNTKEPLSGGAGEGLKPR
ncbi:hypothetical protein GCM10010234_42260 [Streptomyces hawaiiensis]